MLLDQGNVSYPYHAWVHLHGCAGIMYPFCVLRCTIGHVSLPYVGFKCQDSAGCVLQSGRAPYVRTFRVLHARMLLNLHRLSIILCSRVALFVRIPLLFCVVGWCQELLV